MNQTDLYFKGYCVDSESLMRKHHVFRFLEKIHDSVHYEHMSNSHFSSSNPGVFSLLDAMDPQIWLS